MREVITIGEKDIKVSNDYSQVEEEFRKATGQNITNLCSETIQFVKDPISIVVPTYISERLNLVLQSLENQIYRNFEVIIVDDGSPNDIASKFKDIEIHFPVKYIRIPENKGKSTARNIGISASDSKIIAIVDSDMISPKDFTAKMAVRHHFTEKSLFVGFKECIEYEDYISKGKYKAAAISGDWRYQVENNKKFLNLTIKQSFNGQSKGIYRLVEESDNFKSFSYGASIGCWDLPCMVIGHSICFKKDEAVEAGGFIEGLFKGWGMNDIAFGASMVANGNFVIPALDWVSYHINHGRYSGSREIEEVELEKNLDLYLKQYLSLPLGGLKFIHHAIKKIKVENNVSYYESG